MPVTFTIYNDILVVDDDETTRVILRKMLMKDGWHVEEAEHGKDAMECINDNKPELILLDLLMPVMDGFELLNILKADDNLKESAKWKVYGLVYGLTTGVGVAITFGVALDSIAIGISLVLGSGVSLGVGLSMLLSKRKSC